MGWFVGSIRSGALITNERLRLWPAALLIGFGIAIVYLLATAHGINDYKGRPLGADFSNIYAAGTYAHNGDAAAPFDPPRQYAREKAIFGAGTPFYGWHYPPFFLLIAAPLASLRYLPALFVWQITTLALYLGALAALLWKVEPALARRSSWILLALAYPAVFINLLNGHNGFLTAALLAGAIAILDERPLVSGVLFGLLAYKPQFGLMIPLVLIATARWRVFVTAALTVLALACIVTASFGFEVWPAFIASTHFTRTVVLEQGNTGFNKIQSVFAWVRLWGGSIELAYVVQGVVIAFVAVVLVRIWRDSASFAYKGAALCLAALLSTPYSLDYDMMALAPVIALVGAQGAKDGFAPYEKIMLAALWLVPLVARTVAGATFIPVGIIAMMAMGVLIARNALKTDGQQRFSTDVQTGAILNKQSSAVHRF